MPAPTPEFIYFDMGNVLLRFDHEIACRQMGEVANVSAEVVRRVVFEGDLQWKYERGELSSGQFYRAFCEQTGTRPPYEELLVAASDIFEVEPAATAVAAQLKRAGHRLGLLSNTCEAHWQFISGGRFRVIGEYFDVYALSYQIGAAKPQPEIYRKAAELAGSPPPAIFFADDRLENVEGARQSGFDAIQYHGASQLATELRARGIRFNY